MTTAVRSFPLELVPDAHRAVLERLGIPGLPGADLVTAEDLPRDLKPGWRAIPLPGGDRREVLVGASAGLDALPPGERLKIPAGRGGHRLRALLAGLYPELQAVDEDRRNGSGIPAILPLWPDPTLEVRGEVLDPAAWLPAPGQGLPVVLCAPRVELPGLNPDRAAGRVLACERALARLFGNSVLCCRTRSFGDGLRLSAVLLSPDGRQAVRGAASGPGSDPAGLAHRVGALLRRRGADLVTPLSTPFLRMP